MNIAFKIRRWDINHPVALTVFRVILGTCLATRGIYFLNNTEPLYDLIKTSSLNSLHIDMQLAMMITWVHILGGTLIILGLITRIAVWAQIPILLGAIVFIHVGNTEFATFADIALCVFLLILSVLFALEGGGQVSMDNYVKRHLL